MRGGWSLARYRLFSRPAGGGKVSEGVLSLRQVDFPLLHNLAALVEICKGEDESFGQVRQSAESLTPYAVEARYDEDFWPDLETTGIAVQRAAEIREFIAARIPAAVSLLPGGHPDNTAVR